MQFTKNDIYLILGKIKSAVICFYNGAVKHISSVKAKINKKITVKKKKQTDIKVVNVKIKKVTVKKQDKNETN